MDCFRWLSPHAHPAAVASFLDPTVISSRPSDSDHNAILFSLGLRSQPCVSLLSWNILCQYGYNETYKFAYDGWARRFEANDDYMARLARTAEHVRSYVDLHKPDAILLQECAEDNEFGHRVMRDLLEKRLSPYGYSVLQQGEFVTAAIAPLMQVNLPELQRQSNKVQAIYSTKLNCVLLNVHLKYDKNLSENSKLSREDLQLLVRHVRQHFPNSHIVLAGDTNRVPKESLLQTDVDAATIEQLTDGLGHLCYPPGPTNVRWSGELKGAEMTYADFCLWVTPSRSSPVASSCLACLR